MFENNLVIYKPYIVKSINRVTEEPVRGRLSPRTQIPIFF
jgi:hypothetical protein